MATNEELAKELNRRRQELKAEKLQAEINKTKAAAEAMRRANNPTGLMKAKAAVVKGAGFLQAAGMRYAAAEKKKGRPPWL